MRVPFAVLAFALLFGGVAVAEEKLPAFDPLWDYAKPAETEMRFRELLPQAEAGKDLDYELQLRTQIARTLGIQKKFEDAHRELDLVEKRLTDAVPVARVRYLLERGRALNSSNHEDKAKPLFKEAWTLGVKAKADVHAIDAAHMLGIVLPPDEQRAWHEKAMVLAEKSKDERARSWLGALYNNLGWTYFEMKKYEKALEIHKKGLAFREKAGQTKPTLIAKWAVARMLRALERYDEALKIQETLLEAWKKVGEENGFVYEEIGELLLATEDEPTAGPWFVKAWAKLKDSWLQEHEPERYARLRKLAGAEPVEE